MDEDVSYLAPGFDPATLTVPRLRSLLLEYNVSYPSSAKKPQLIELFNENIAAKSKRILSSRARVKRSSGGIEDIASSQEAQADEEEERIPARTPSRRSRKTTGTAIDGADEEPATTRKSTAKPRSRQSAVTPSIRHSVRDVKPEEQEESPFTEDNPFQSGSSPIPEAPRTDRKRRTMDPAELKKRKKSPSTRRKTDLGINHNEEDGAMTTTFQMSASKLNRKPQLIEAGEEFTPDEQTALRQEMERTGKVDVLPSRSVRTPKRKSGSVAKTAPWAILLAILGGVGTVWRQEKLQVGYCGVGQGSTEIAGVEIPEWADSIRPQCEPCPSHAFCSTDLHTTCEDDFVLKPHPLSMGGLVPLPPTCEPDGEKARKVKAVADRAVEELRERNAKFECGELKDDGGKKATTPEIPEPELKKEVSNKRRKGMTNEEFEDLWHGALGEIMSRDEIISGSDGPLSGHSLRSNSLARLPLACAVRRSIRLALARHLFSLSVVGAVLVLAGFLRHRISSARATSSQAKLLASSALDRLATQAALHAGNSERHPEPWISVAGLRDDVLRAEFSSSRRQKLWGEVKTLVEGNANVRAAVREGERTGEVGRVWEWVGALPDVSSPGNDAWSGVGDRRRSGGMEWMTSPIAGSDAQRQEMAELPTARKWDEGRPIY